MRMIDADAFIEMMEEKCDTTKFADVMVLTICKGAIDKMPTVNQWIPCSERLRYGYVHLPSEEEDVLICFKYADEYCYDVATFYRDDDPIDGGEAFESESMVYELDEVLAWMPLPEPYKEDIK